MTTNEVIVVVTAFVTYVFGILAKKFGWASQNYIPVQNLLIGIFAGLLVYFSGLNDNVISAIIICAASAFAAGGAYDFSRVNENNIERKKQEQLEEAQAINGQNRGD